MSNRKPKAKCLLDYEAYTFPHPATFKARLEHRRSTFINYQICLTGNVTLSYMGIMKPINMTFKRVLNTLPLNRDNHYPDF